MESGEYISMNITNWHGWTRLLSQHIEGRSRQIYEFEASLVNTASVRLGRTT